MEDHRQTHPILVMSHHKCATQWLMNYLRELARCNNLTFEVTHESQEAPAADIIFLCNAEYDFVAQVATQGIHVIRNPLSVITSAYFSHIRTHPLDGWPQLEIQRAILLDEGKDTGLFLTTAFLERADFCPGVVGPLYGLRSWDYTDTSFVNVRMEDLVESPGRLLGEALARAGFEVPRVFPPDADFTFQAFSGGRPAGHTDDDSHYRTGDPDDWHNHLPAPIVRYVTRHMRALFERFYPEVLSRVD